MDDSPPRVASSTNAGQPGDASTPTVEMSLGALSEALVKAVDDLTAVHGAIEMTRDSAADPERLDARATVVAATHALDELRRVDEAMTEVLRTLDREKRPPDDVDDLDYTPS